MFCGGSKSAKGSPNPLADLDRGGGVQIRGGSKSAVTPAQFNNETLIEPFFSYYL